jgi:hypothetical protein
MVQIYCSTINRQINNVSKSYSLRQRLAVGCDVTTKCSICSMQIYQFFRPISIIRGSRTETGVLHFVRQDYEKVSVQSHATI